MFIHLFILLASMVLGSVICFFIDFSNNMICYLTDVNNNLSMVFTAMLGIYIAVIVLFATSRTPAAKRFIDTGTFDSFLKIIMFSMTYSGISIVISCLELTNQYIVLFNTVLFIVSGGYSIAFMCLTFKIFKYNTKELDEQARYDEKLKEETFTIIKEIYNRLNDNNKS